MFVLVSLNDDEAEFGEFIEFMAELSQRADLIEAQAQAEFDEWVAKMEAHERLYGDDLCWQ